MVKSSGINRLYPKAAARIKMESCISPSVPIAMHLPRRIRDGLVETIKVSITLDVFSDATDIATP